MYDFDVSVVIPTRNRWHLETPSIRHCVKKVCRLR